MKVLLINGSPHENGTTFAALSEIQKQLSGNGVDSEILWLGTDALISCRGCGGCAKLAQNRCVFSNGDVVEKAAEIMKDCDGLIVGSPVHYAGPTGQVTSFLGRLFYSAGSLLQGKPAASVVCCRRGGASAAYESLNKYFQMSNMPLVTSQYWNMVYGTDAKTAALDLEGMQTMRTLADNMAYMLKSIKSASASGIEAPVREAKIKTNFIR